MTTRELKRLIADEGKVLQNTKTGKTAYCVDVFAENVDLWKEIEDVTKKRWCKWKRFLMIFLL